MKKFLVLFTCQKDGQNHQAWKSLSIDQQKERMNNGLIAREEWNKKYKKQILQEQILHDTTKVINSQGIIDIPSKMGAFTIIEASSHDEVAELFKEHPHFTFFPGDGVEILECVEGP